MEVSMLMVDKSLPPDLAEVSSMSGYVWRVLFRKLYTSRRIHQPFKLFRAAVLFSL